jgi:adenine-specific DNA glycosylase
MTAANNIEANEISRLKIANSVIRIIQNNNNREAQRFQNQQWEPLTKADISVLILNRYAKPWLNEHCETLVGQYEEDKAEQQHKEKIESIRRANEWQHIADLKHGKLEVRVLEFKASPIRKAQLLNKDRWQDCTEQDILAIRSISPFNELFIQHFDDNASKSLISI